MNKFINMLLLVLMMPVMVLTIVVGFDLPLEIFKISGANISYKKEVFLGFGVLVLLIGARRSIRRWMGLKMVSQLKRFQWNAPMAKSRYRQAVLYLVLEAAIHLFVALGLYLTTSASWPVAGVLALLALDHLVFAFVGKAKQLFRTGITSKAILVADRDLKAIYFSGLRQVSIHQQSMFFDYIKDLQISIPVDSIALNERAMFRDQLSQNVDRSKVFFAESFKEF